MNLLTALCTRRLYAAKLEAMTNDQMTLWRQPCRLHSLVSQATRPVAAATRTRPVASLPLQFIRHSWFVISAVAILMLMIQMCCSASAQGQSPNSPAVRRDQSVSPRRPDMIGRWNVEINFADGNKRSLRFDVQDHGKGTFLLL